uniref:Pituitary tumor-transforming gene 1 protein-interacting protein-like n=1 Tax=Poecilia formosa TaxID=48698 RepID=A0A096MFR3_POEFO
MNVKIMGIMGINIIIAISIFVSQGKCQTTAPPPPRLFSACSINKNCDSCVPHAKCLWCFATNNCTDYPVTWLLPPASLCPLSQARWGVCWLNFEALIIALAVVAGTILISISVCVCGVQSLCCMCSASVTMPDRDEERFARRREEIRQRAEERKVERQSKHDEIRRKYGLMGDSDHPYSKFENE